MTWTWFDLAWPWIGAVAAAVILSLLFATSVLRSDCTKSQWRDPLWLSWLAVPIYMIHNVEEYGIDAVGRRHAFPDAMCGVLGLAPFPACPISPAFFLAVNISLIWVAAPVAALLGRRHPLVGFVFYGLLVTNGVTHIVPLLAGKGFGPGTLSAILLFLPAFFWIARTCFGPRLLPYRGLAVIVGAGVLVHAILMGTLLLFLHAEIGSPTLIGLQVVNAAVFLGVPWIGERFLNING